MHWKNFAEVIGFTNTEYKIILFLIAVFIVGLFLKYLNRSEIKLINYDYSISDSAFFSAGKQNDDLSITADKDNLITREKNFSVKKELPKENSININNAGLKELTLLPGIGDKTAQNIINYRAVHKFVSLDDLILVKGISNAKFNKIKKYIVIK